MIGEIMNAFCLEVQSIFENNLNTEMQQVTVLRDTQFKPNEIGVHTMPCVVISLTDSPEMQQLPGGCLQANWGWIIKAYFYDAGQDLSPDEGLTSNEYEIIDLIRKHIAFQKWNTIEFQNVVKNYSYKMTLNGTNKADPLELDGGICPGFSISYDSICIDGSTSFTTYSDATLQKALQNSIDDETISIDKTTLSYSSSGGDQTVTITTNTAWSVDKSVSWISLSDINGRLTKTITITATSNLTNRTRTTTVIVKAPLSTITDKVITITQTGI